MQHPSARPSTLRSGNRRQRQSRGFESLEPRHLLAADVLLNEFMSANQTTVRDAFGASSDWIELRNAGDAEADLTGYYLTDDPDNLSKWSFPDGVRLAPGDFLLVYASGFDTTDSDGVFHTSFQLSSSGGYVALISADFEVLSSYGDDGRDYPPQFADVSFGRSGAAEPRVGFMTQPTPGQTNSTEIANVGPTIEEVTEQPGAIAADAPLVVTARVSPDGVPVAQVQLAYLVMYEAESIMPMRDDGTNGDAVADDGEYTATIPAGTAMPGQMIRWYVTASDTSDQTSRAPAFLDQSGSDQSPQYFGTVVADPQVDSEIPIFQWFIEPGSERRADSQAGTRSTVYYAGELYDNVYVRLRGGSSRNLPKKSYKFDFNTAHDFRFHPDHGRVSEININTTYSNKDYIRQALAFETYDAAGLPASEAFPLRLQRNGEFFAVSIFVEQPDADLLAREGLDPSGALYKVFNTLDSPNGNVEKKTREYEDNSDFADFVREINRLSGDDLRNYVYDNLNVPAVLNYLAATVISQNNDQMAKNYFLYRDTNGSGEWMLLPWDLDLVFGLHFMSNDSILDDLIWAKEDNITTFANVTISPSHPFVGDQEHPGNRSWNRLIDALYEIPEFREMYLRRLRSMMDELLQPPDTPVGQLRFEARLDEFVRQLGPDVALDYEKWANPWRWGNDEPFQQSIQRLKDEYLAVRRTHLYDTHSIHNLEPDEIVTLLPEFAPASYFVPGDDSIGDAWTALEFDDTMWAVGSTGIGFENDPGDYADLIKTRVKPIEVAEDSTSVFVRIPFTIADLTLIEDLTLQMKYDDGFVAYVNGTEVARNNLRRDGPQSYDSRARSHSTARAIEFENFEITQHIDTLRAGDNVLAIHIMNSSASNSDLLLLPQLVEGEIRTIDIAGIPDAQSADLSLEFGDTIQFNPPSGNQDEEYLSIFNPNGFAVDVSGWQLTGSAHTTFVPGTVINAGQSLYVTPNVVAFRARAEGPSGNQGLLVQHYDGHLANAGDTLQLHDASGRLVTSAQYVGGVVSAHHDLRITEINYNPHDALTQFGELDTDNDSFEFIEISNTGSQVVDLSGVALVEITMEGDNQGISYEFAAGQLAAGERIVVVKSRAAFVSRYGNQALVAGEFQGKLSNGGETLTLHSPGGDVVQQFRYNDATGWPALADGDGGSLVVVDTGASYDEPTNWRASREVGGSPGVDEIAPRRDVVINEILSRTDAPAVDQIELFNTGAQAVDISGWYLSDSANPVKFQLPENSILGAGGYFVLDQNQLGFGFRGSDADDARLIRSGTDGRPAGFADFVQFAAGNVGVAQGRWPNGVGHLVPMISNTFGGANSGPAAGDLNGDRRLTADDVDLLCRAIGTGEPLPGGDLNQDGQIDADDLDHLLVDILGTTFGDANLDGVFDSSDLVKIFRAGEYEDSIADNSGWATGDWNCDREFDSSDLVAAFRAGGYQ